jgi:hypothetical protein
VCVCVCVRGVCVCVCVCVSVCVCVCVYVCVCECECPLHVMQSFHNRCRCRVAWRSAWCSFNKSYFVLRGAISISLALTTTPVLVRASRKSSSINIHVDVRGCCHACYDLLEEDHNIFQPDEAD